MLDNIIMQREFLLTQVWRDFTERYHGSLLGVGWGFLGPLVNILLYTLIFSQLMSARLPGAVGDSHSYSVYLISGLLPWMTFAATVNRVSTQLQDQSGILSKVNLPLPMLPWIIVLSESLTLLIGVVIFLVFYCLMGYSLHPLMLLLPLVYVLQQLFAYALGFLLAQFNMFFRDIRQITGLMTHIWFWLTPIAYVPAILPESVWRLLQFNPMVHLLGVWQNLFVYHRLPDMTGIIVILIVVPVLLLLALWSYGKLEKEIRDAL